MCFYYGYKEIDDHIKEISALRNAINGLIYTIERTGDYFPAELEAIHELMVKVMDSEKKFLQMMNKYSPKKTEIV